MKRRWSDSTIGYRFSQEGNQVPADYVALLDPKFVKKKPADDQRQNVRDNPENEECLKRKSCTGLFV